MVDEKTLGKMKSPRAKPVVSFISSAKSAEAPPFALRASGGPHLHSSTGKARGLLRRRIKTVLSSCFSGQENRAFIFGSQADGTAVGSSDLDIGLESKREIPLSSLSRIREAFEESDLPFVVEIVDFNRVSPEFSRQAKRKTINLF